MKKLMILAVLLSLVLVSCEKKPVEPETEMIEVSFNASLYELDFQTNLKSVPGYPDINHVTDLNLFNCRIILWNVDKEYDFEFLADVGEFNNATVLLEPGNYSIKHIMCYIPSMPFYSTSAVRFYTEVQRFFGGYTISSVPTVDPIFEISNTSTQIDFEIVMYQNCFVFSDPDNLIKEITEAGYSEETGILKSQMNTVDYDGETFYYCYNSVWDNLWIYTTDGSRLNLNFGDYYNSLDEADKWNYPTAIEMNHRPFTIYTTIVPNTSENANIIFAVSNVYPNVEVEIPLE
jgi:hypothetical protein